MSTTRYFEVKVTGCMNCPNCEHSRCEHPSVLSKQWNGSRTIYIENHNQLTDSCPMWGETKESETK